MFPVGDYEVGLLILRTTVVLPLNSCGHFMSLIMGDYVAGFLGLSEGNAWNMNAFAVSVGIGIRRVHYLFGVGSQTANQD